MQTLEAKTESIIFKPLASIARPFFSSHSKTAAFIFSWFSGRAQFVCFFPLFDNKSGREVDNDVAGDVNVVLADFCFFGADLMENEHIW